MDVNERFLKKFIHFVFKEDWIYSIYVEKDYF